MPLGPDIIHSVINPVRRLTGAIHVYGGDFFAATHSQWDPERLLEEPYDVKRLLALFAYSGDREQLVRPIVNTRSAGS